MNVLRNYNFPHKESLKICRLQLEPRTVENTPNNLRVTDQPNRPMIFAPHLHVLFNSGNSGVGLAYDFSKTNID